MTDLTKEAVALLGAMAAFVFLVTAAVFVPWVVVAVTPAVLIGRKVVRRA